MLGPGAPFHQNPRYCYCCTPLLLYPSNPRSSLGGGPTGGLGLYYYYYYYYYYHHYYYYYDENNTRLILQIMGL